MQKAKKPRSLRLSPGQAAQLRELRERLGELGYLIFLVARRFRTHRQDFLAVHRTYPREFLVIKPRCNDRLTIQSYCLAAQHQDAIGLTDKLRAEGSRIHWLKQISPGRKNLRLEHFLAEKSAREYKQLMPPHQTAGS